MGHRRTLLKKWVKRKLRPVLRPFYLFDHVFPQEEALRNDDVRNVRVLNPAHRVEIASPATDPFVPIGRYYREGWFERPDLFVCEMPDAYAYVKTGMICTRNWKVVTDIEARLPYFEKFEERRPRKFERVAGTCAVISYCYAWNHYHWMVDCLPKIITLARAEPDRPITIIASADLGRVQRESLEILLPSNFTVAYYPPETWLQVETLLWPSLLTGRCNAFLPADYFEAIRRPIFERFGLPPKHEMRERIYLTRRSSETRRILNEDALVAFLEPYGFRCVDPGKLSFREQVELFHRAEIVLGPHGAGFNLIFFSGKIKVIVLQPNREPQNHFHTLALGLGQDHHFTINPSDDREANFDADLPAIQRILDEIELKSLRLS